MQKYQREENNVVCLRMQCQQMILKILTALVLIHSICARHYLIETEGTLLQL